MNSSWSSLPRRYLQVTLKHVDNVQHKYVPVHRPVLGFSFILEVELRPFPRSNKLKIVNAPELSSAQVTLDPKA